MFRLLGLVISIGLADSLNPSTIAPALYLASGEHARRDIARFTLGVFVVYFGGGVLVALGPGQLLLSLVPHPDAEDRHVLEIIAGVAMLLAGTLLWRHRARLSDRPLPTPKPGGRSTAILGATITAVEFPTAFPYFAAIAAIVGSGLSPVHQVVLLLIFNLCFVLPLVGILATLWLFPSHADQILSRGRAFLQRHWPKLLAGVALLAGVFVVLLGVTGFAQHSRGRFGRLMRHVNHFLHHP
jgi:cytochrome c biogenesis protein CcdA